MKKLLPVLILLIAGGIATVLVIFKPDAQEVSPERPITQVEVIEAKSQNVQLTIQSQGTLLPRTESDLSAEVSGRIIEVSDSFRAGGNFSEGEPLVKIDPADYEAILANTEAELANAQLALAQEKALAEQAAADWAALGEGEASELTLRKPQLAQANARIKSAQASLKRAQRDLDRTVVRAPFDGRVLRTNADLGQFVSAAPATPIARVFATDRAEIRLPITESDAELLETRDRKMRFVQLRKNSDHDANVWTARFARLEATVDTTSRLLYAVAELDQPFTPNQKHPETLRRGQFLHAEIEGRSISDAYVLPRYALRGSDTVYVLNEAGKAITRKVSIIKSDAKEVVITDGLTDGDRVITSPIAYYIEGMPVEVIADES